MQDSDLHIHPDNWGNNSRRILEQEISQGSTDALQYKLQYIDDKIANLECIVLGEDAARQGKIIWDKIVALSAWYTLIENEVHKRIVEASVNRMATKAFVNNANVPLYQIPTYINPC